MTAKQTHIDKHSGKPKKYKHLVSRKVTQKASAAIVSPEPRTSNQVKRGPSTSSIAGRKLAVIVRLKLILKHLEESDLPLREAAKVQEHVDGVFSLLPMEDMICFREDSMDHQVASTEQKVRGS